MSFFDHPDAVLELRSPLGGLLTRISLVNVRTSIERHIDQHQSMTGEVCTIHGGKTLTLTGTPISIQHESPPGVSPKEPEPKPEPRAEPWGSF